jgi:predicted RNA-binding Zn ribbon-like protein
MSRAAPGDLETLRAFVNTYDPDAGGDAIGDPEALRAWLVQRGLADAGEVVDAAGQRRAVRLREAVRRLGEANHDGLVDVMAAEDVDRIAAECHLVVRMGADGVARLEAAEGGIDGALAGLLAILYTAAVDGTWPRFKVCRSDTCGWAFYDQSRNRSGRFCGTACGNAVNARAYRRRKAAASPAAH